MRSQHLSMTIEEFKRMPRKPGWKYEYWHNQAHISPAHRYLETIVEVKLLPVNSPCQIRPVQAGDEPRLISLYLAAFRDTIEYCDWKLKKIETSASNNIKDFFIGRWGRPLPASRAAVCWKPNGGEEHIVGAALISEKKDGQPVLDMLFVAPPLQRKGVASSLVSAAINELFRGGYKGLKSSYHAGNEASSSWHRNFGFKI
jgi:GNAT superfamily N-acetyltransferase